MNRFFNLNTYFKLLLLIISAMVFFIVLYISLYLYGVRGEEDFYKTTVSRYDIEVKSLFKLNSRTLAATIIDVTFWDDLVEFTKTEDIKWYNKYISNEFESYDADFVGVYNLEGKQISKTISSKISGADFIPKSLLAALYKSKLKTFYVKIPEGVVEVYGATIHPSNDSKKNKTLPSGYFFIARLLDESFFEGLGTISSSYVNLAPANYKITAQDDIITVGLELKDWNEKVVNKLIFKRPFNLNYSKTKEVLFVVVLASIVCILIFIYYTKKWVYNPIEQIRKILEIGDTNSINELKKFKGEFVTISDLFEENRNQRIQLEIAKLKAEESDNLKSSFLANLSHEIRTPMNAIIGYSDLLSDNGLDDKEKRKYLKIIKSSGTNLVAIIEDLIEMSKIDARQIAPNYKSLDLDKCINDLYNSIKITIPKEKNIEFYIVDNLEHLHTNILSDEIKLKQIIVNLVTNALKFTDEGFVSFGYTIYEEKGIIEFTVEDSGKGIDDNHLKVIFERFRRLEDNTSKETNGLGLGLCITKAYVEMLGGEIFVKSKIGFGSSFTFTLPLKLDAAIKESKENKLVKITRNVNGKTILIAEDNTINFLLLKKIVESKGHFVIRAINGQEAIALCVENLDIDLVFMDIKMPILNGFQSFEQIKALKPNLPVIAQTACSSFEDKDKIIQCGFSDYITKPFDKEKVYEVLDIAFNTESIDIL